MKLLLMCCCLCYTVAGTFAVFAATTAHKSEFGGALYDFWRWDHAGYRNNWRKECEKYNISRSSSADSAIQTRITGGNLAETNMFPYQVGLLLLRAPMVYQCGGVLIAANWVLTAAHCLLGSTRGKVYLGSTDYANEQTSAAVYNVSWRDFYLHEKYIFSGGYYDIALIRLPEAAPLSEAVQTIRLAKSFMQQQFLEGKTVTASGWGLTSDVASAEQMQPNLLLYFVDAPVLPQEQCACYYLRGLVRQRYHICTAGDGGRGSCDGDSGGPLTFYYENSTYLVGLTAFGSAGGCEIGFPSVYTRITTFLDWISQRTDIVVS